MKLEAFDHEKEDNQTVDLLCCSGIADDRFGFSPGFPAGEGRGSGNTVPQWPGYAPMVEEDHPLYQRYIAEHPEQKIFLARAGDLTNDGVDELVVIYLAGKDGSCETVVLVNENGTYYETPPTPAPREYQKMRFFIKISHMAR